MTDFTPLLQPDHGQPAHLIQTVRKDGFDEWLAGQPERVRAIAGAARFGGRPGEFVLLPGGKPEEWSVAVGVPDTAGPWDLAAAVARLPEGMFRLADGDPGPATLGWLLAHHRFDRYLGEAEPVPRRVLLVPDTVDTPQAIAMAEAVALVRDLVDTPAGDMGPAELAAAADRIANECGANFTVVQGDALAEGYPMIHAVGRAATPARAPRLIALNWGDAGAPAVTIVGKGVCFDSGGLDIKPAAGMLTMKKDMGGAAHALALARLVMRARLPVRLTVLVPAVENAISADAFRPGDILRSRRGLSVEIGNTDAEGRLILADALTHAVEGEPALLIDFATLTGAARVALGPDLPALFASDDALAGDLLAAGIAAGDPLWRLPLHDGYRDMLQSTVADLNNSGEGGFAGAITAALFLKAFVPDGIAWAHIDTFAWRPAAKPGRPKGGEALSLRAVYGMLRARFS